MVRAWAWTAMIVVVNESSEQAELVCHSLLRTNGHSSRGSGRDLALYLVCAAAPLHHALSRRFFTTLSRDIAHM